MSEAKMWDERSEDMTRLIGGKAAEEVQ